MLKTLDETTQRMTETPNPPLSGTSLSGHLSAWNFTAGASTWTVGFTERGRPRNPFAAVTCHGTLRNLRWTVTASSKPLRVGMED
jgi:hypothetical protein